LILTGTKGGMRQCETGYEEHIDKQSCKLRRKVTRKIDFIFLHRNIVKEAGGKSRSFSYIPKKYTVRVKQIERNLCEGRGGAEGGWRNRISHKEETKRVRTAQKISFYGP